MRTLLLVSLAVAGLALSGGRSSGDARDASQDAGGAPQNVQRVECTGTPPLVKTGDNVYVPASTTIAPGGMVHFVLAPNHNLSSTTAGQIFSLDFGDDACLQFDVAGTYTFRCTAHPFSGTVVVQ